MDLTIDIRFSVSMPESEKEDLLNYLGIENDTLNDSLTKLAKASIEEYILMLAGNPMFSKADEIKQLRLFLIICNYFDEGLPTVQQISSMFHITDTASNTLLKNVLSKYSKDLEDRLNQYISKMLDNAEPRDKKKIMVCTSPEIMARMNQKLSTEAPRLKKVNRVPGTVGEIECSVDTYNKLKELYGPQNGK